MDNPSFASAMRKTFFHNEPVGKVAEEMKALSMEDKQYFHRELNKAGIACTAPVGSA